MNFGSVMNWTDIILLAIVLFSGTIGLFRGIAREIISLLSWIFGIYFGFKYAAVLGSFIESYIAIDSLRNVICFLLIFIGVFVFSAVIKRFLSNLISKGGAGFADRFFGLIFGIARGFVFIFFLIFLGGLGALTEEPWWRQAKFAEPLESAVKIVLVWSPSKFETDLNF
jgi:membrane protein required for colicin V production